MQTVLASYPFMWYWADVQVAREILDLPDLTYEVQPVANEEWVEQIKASYVPLKVAGQVSSADCIMPVCCCWLCRPRVLLPSVSTKKFLRNINAVCSGNLFFHALGCKSSHK